MFVYLVVCEKDLCNEQVELCLLTFCKFTYVLVFEKGLLQRLGTTLSGLCLSMLHWLAVSVLGGLWEGPLQRLGRTLRLLLSHAHCIGLWKKTSAANIYNSLATIVPCSLTCCQCTCSSAESTFAGIGRNYFWSLLLYVCCCVVNVKTNASQWYVMVDIRRFIPDSGGICTELFQDNVFLLCRTQGCI